MIFSMLFFFLFLFVLSGILFFIFNILLPALHQQAISTEAPLFSREEIQFAVQKNELKPEHFSKVAVVRCSPERNFEKERMNYYGIKNCKLFFEQCETLDFCDWSCVGLGDCVPVCPQEAIQITNGVAVVSELCSGCGNCVDVCPKKIIKLVNLNFAECKHCAVPAEEKTDCSKCHSVEKNELPPSKDFKFWERCYKLFFGK
jgi:ferredoxin